MFYVKEKINEVMEVRIEVGSDNVFGICPVSYTHLTLPTN